jgi:Fic family protein
LIHRRRKDYYSQLQAANKTLDVDPWLNWFADLVLAAQTHTLQGLDFLLASTRLLDRLRDQLNERQEKALSRLMRTGVDGFVGGLSASKYMAITGAPAATARRDLGHLVELGALQRTGQLKGTRYWLPHGLPVAALGQDVRLSER